MVTSRSFTTKADGLLNVLKNTCSVSLAFNPNSGGIQPVVKEFIAIWDTGATNSVITQRVVDECNLAPTGMVTVHHANGSDVAETYLVNIGLPNSVVFIGLRVTKGVLAGADMLIGMDVINQGDFSVTNVGGRTMFSFRYPSQSSIDFVADGKRPQFQHGGQGKARTPRPKPSKNNKKR